MNVAESISMAVDAVRAHKLRSSLTLLSIGIGVFAIIASSGITGTLSQTVGSQMRDLGENSILIMRVPDIMFGHNWRKYAKRPDVTLDHARELRERMTTTDLISVSNTASGFTVKHQSESTNPEVMLIGIDDMYHIVNALNITEGRAFSGQDLLVGANIAVIGTDLLPLFPDGKPLGKRITIRNRDFTVVGVLERKGGIVGQSQDNRVMIPLPVFVKYYTHRWDTSVDISMKAYSSETLQATYDEAVGLMRTLRKLKPWEDNNFEADLNDALQDQFSSLTLAIIVVAWISGLGALAAAGIGIMNMMLVSVKERTREIGVRKALGARKAWIVRQFLIESVTLCQLGGLTGVVGGLATTYAVMYFVRSTASPGLTFVFPWFAIVFSVAACTLIGVGFGLYPAWKAARLDPIEALRYE
jgi:putative ABC transport system permease protein